MKTSYPEQVISVLCTGFSLLHTLPFPSLLLLANVNNRSSRQLTTTEAAQGPLCAGEPSGDGPPPPGATELFPSYRHFCTLAPFETEL